jgi:glutathione S-transferase
MTHTLKLVSFDLCPFVERSRIVLLEKGVPHEVQFIDLRNKPPWFLTISPMGKVPVLVCDDQPIFESMVINELIEELYPAPRMFPEAPLKRAVARGWIVFANDALMPAGHRAMQALAEALPEAEARGEGSNRDQAIAALRTCFETLEHFFERREGRFFLGNDFDLVDAAYAPFLRRWIAAERWGDARLLADFPRLAHYAETLLSHPSVVKADPGDIGARMRPAYLEMARRAATRAV